MTSHLTELYALFGVTQECTDEALRRAYRALLLRVHPDHNSDNVEEATRKTEDVIAAYGVLTRHREQGSHLTEATHPPAPSASFGFSLDLVQELKQEFREAWESYSCSTYDIKATLRLVRAAFDAGRADAIQDLLRNGVLIDAATILFDIYTRQEAAGTIILWAEYLCNKEKPSLALRLLEDALESYTGDLIPPETLKSALRSIHYGLAQGYYTHGVKPLPKDRIEHLTAIIRLGYELGYVHKLLAEAFHELGRDDAAREHLARALAIDPQLSGAKKIRKALNMIDPSAPPARPKSTSAMYLYKRTRDVPSASILLQWFRNADWDRIIPRSTVSNYSPRVLPRARETLVVAASLLGECSDRGNSRTLRDLLTCVYWDVRQAAFLSLAKTGDSTDLLFLRQNASAVPNPERMASEAVAYCEARITGASSPRNTAAILSEMEPVVRAYGYAPAFWEQDWNSEPTAPPWESNRPTPGRLGRLRWLLEYSIRDREKTPEVIACLAHGSLFMGDWPRVLTLVEREFAIEPDSTCPQMTQIHIDYAAALVQAGAQTPALGVLRAIYDGMSQEAKHSANRVLWEALLDYGFIGETHFLWALEILLKSVIQYTSPSQLLTGLHFLARAMEPIGQTEKATWLRHLLRSEAPGHWFGDSHDRLNYFNHPQLSTLFEADLQKLWEAHQQLITEALRIVLGSDPAVPPNGPKPLSS